MKSNYYIVRREGQYHYFPVKVRPDTKNRPIMRFEKGPPLLLDGYVVVDRVLYSLPVRDIQRGQINTLRKIEQTREKKPSGRTRTTPTPASTGNVITPAASGIPVATVEPPPGNTGHGSAVNTPLLDVSEAADAAWKRQVESILDAIHSEEDGEWEIADTPQS